MWKISIIREKNIEANEKNMKMWYPVATTALTLVKILLRLYISSVQFSHLGHVWLCDPINHSTPGLPVHHQLPEFTQTHVHWISDAIQPSHPLSSPSHPALNLSQHQCLFKWVSSLHQVDKLLVSASTSVLPVNTQDWSPLGLMGLVSLLSRGLSRVFSTTVWKPQFFGTQPSL